MSEETVRYLVFDVESAADGELVSRIRYPGEDLSAAEAIQRYRAELIEKYETDFIPYTFQVPVSIAIAKVNAKFELLDLVTLDQPDYRPHVMTSKFWEGWAYFDYPTLVSFNGRSFDVPLLELAAFRYGISVPGWFNIDDKSWDQKRNRYNVRSHFDLQDLFTNFGASRLNGGLNLLANLIGKPGKMDIKGDNVQDLVDAQEFDRINDYCRCDVLDTYFVFLRANVMTGKLKRDREHELVAQTKNWLEAHSDQQQAYTEYLSQWGSWNNPWTDTPETSDTRDET